MRTSGSLSAHGCSKALAALTDAIQPAALDTLVFVGDYINRGPDSRGVLEQGIDLSQRCTVVPLLGNHEEMLLVWKEERRTCCSGSSSVGWTPSRPMATAVARTLGPLTCRRSSHAATWISSRIAGTTTRQSAIFVHAYYEPKLPLHTQNWSGLRWASLPANPEPHCSGKVAIVGHMPQKNGQILDLGFLKCIDTNACDGGWLTALEVESGKVWQANQAGEVRS